VLGRTLGDLEAIVVKGLKGRILVNPKVSVQIDEYRPFYVNGMVEKPGGYPFQPGLTVRKAGGESQVEYMIIDLEEVLITSLSTGGSGSDDRLTENITLNFAQVMVEYQPQKADGTKDGGPIKYGWNIRSNTKR